MGIHIYVDFDFNVTFSSDFSIAIRRNPKRNVPRDQIGPDKSYGQTQATNMGWMVTRRTEGARGDYRIVRLFRGSRAAIARTNWGERFVKSKVFLFSKEKRLKNCRKSKRVSFQQNVSTQIK